MNTECKTSDVMLSSYNFMVVLHLEYAVQFCSLSYRKEIDLLEKIQQSATRIIRTLGAQPFEERLFTLGKRCLQGYVIQVYKYLKKFTNVDYSKFCEVLAN